MRLSVVTTLYRSEPYIHEFYERISAAVRKLAGEQYELIFINDGSPDNGLDLAVDLTTKDDHVVVVDLSRNFGHHKAMMTGLRIANGDRIFLIDSDLEEEPEWISSFSEQMNREMCDVVYGVQNFRKGNWLERWSGQWFYRIFRMLTGMALPRNIVTARLMSRRYVNALVKHREREVFIAGLWYITGFSQHAQTITKHNTSETTYTVRKKIALLVDSVTSFSNAPLVFIFYVGAFISIFALSYIIYLVTMWGFLARPLSGWTSVMASIWLLGGMIISFIGVVGVYLSKIFSEIKRRPYTIVRKIYGRQ